MIITINKFFSHLSPFIERKLNINSDIYKFEAKILIKIIEKVEIV